MGFWGYKRWLFWWGVIYYFLYIGLVFIDRTHDIGSLHSLYSNFFFLLAITKSVMIAIRYAYTSSDNLRKFSERKLYRD